MKIKKEYCEECSGKGEILYNDDGNYCAPYKCEKCYGKGYIEVLPDSNGVFPFSMKRIFCPGCGNGKPNYYYEIEKVNRYIRETYVQIDNKEEILIDNFMDVCCGKCGYRWFEYFDDPENI